MRIMSFSKRWDKLQNSEFTTFRFTRKDRDWEVGELVKVVYHSRHKDRAVLGEARIIKKEDRSMPFTYVPQIHPKISESEVVADGFDDLQAMRKWLLSTYGATDRMFEPIHKLTLNWEYRRVGTLQQIGEY